MYIKWQNINKQIFCCRCMSSFDLSFLLHNELMHTHKYKTQQPSCWRHPVPKKPVSKMPCHTLDSSCTRRLIQNESPRSLPQQKREHDQCLELKFMIFFFLISDMWVKDGSCSTLELHPLLVRGFKKGHLWEGWCSDSGRWGVYTNTNCSELTHHSPPGAVPTLAVHYRILVKRLRTDFDSW